MYQYQVDPTLNSWNIPYTSTLLATYVVYIWRKVINNISTMALNCIQWKVTAKYSIITSYRSEHEGGPVLLPGFAIIW